jgi:uncharacterized protein (DUF58 family)
MTERGRATLALGAAVYLVAWIFGARALYPVATGLVLAVCLAVAWVRLSARHPHVHRHGAARDVIEGDDVRIDLVVEATGAVPPPTLVAHEQPKGLPDRSIELRQVGGRRFVGGYELRAVPRGRYAFERIKLTIADPFALARIHLEQGEPQALVVYPRLVELHGLFSEGGAHAQDGRRLLLRRPTGYDLHSVREYVEGESLRKVHWPSTAHRGRLMVKEIEDAPRDEVVVLLDGDARAGTRQSFDIAVRAAGSILQAQLRRGRRCALVVNSARRDVQPIASDNDWRRALEVLAAAGQDAPTPAFAMLQADGGVAARSLDLLVVTSRLDVPLVDRLVQRALTRRGSAVVYIEPDAKPDPLLLRLQAAGVPVAIVRAGDELGAVLGAREVQVA